MTGRQMKAVILCKTLLLSGICHGSIDEHPNELVQIFYMNECNDEINVELYEGKMHEGPCEWKNHEGQPQVPWQQQQHLRAPIDIVTPPLNFSSEEPEQVQMMDCYKAIRGDILHFIGNPYEATQTDSLDYSDYIKYVPDGVLILKRRRNKSSESFRLSKLSYEYEIDRIMSFSSFESAVGNVQTIVNLQFDDQSSKIVMPGFIDLHVHAAQENAVASYGANLLPWLTKYVLPEEAMDSNDAEYSSIMMEMFVQDLIRAGTTTAAAFTTYNASVADALFTQASKYNLGMIAGAQGQDWFNPNDDFVNATHSLYSKWHGRGRNRYAVTLRFAPGSSFTQMKQTSQLLDLYNDAYFMTHLGETYDETHLASLLYQHDGIPQGLPPNDPGLPPNATYTQLYDYFGLLRPNRSIMGHSIHLSLDDWKLLASKSVSVSHCPTSNNFLGSGLFNVGAAVNAGVNFGIGSDVGAGTHLCALETLGAMYQVAMLSNTAAQYAPEVCVKTFCPATQPNLATCSMHEPNLSVKAHGKAKISQTRLCQGPPSSPPHQTMDRPESDVPPNHIHIHPALAYYTATLGGARALHLSHRIGNFERGRDADIVVLDPFGSYDSARRARFIHKSSSESLDYLWQRLFVLMTTGGSVAATYVMGHALYKRVAREPTLCVLPDNPTFPNDYIETAKCASEMALN